MRHVSVRDLVKFEKPSRWLKKASKGCDNRGKVVVPRIHCHIQTYAPCA